MPNSNMVSELQQGEAKHQTTWTWACLARESTGSNDDCACVCAFSASAAYARQAERVAYAHLMSYWPWPSPSVSVACECWTAGRHDLQPAGRRLRQADTCWATRQFCAAWIQTRRERNRKWRDDLRRCWDDLLNNEQRNELTQWQQQQQKQQQLD